MILIVKIAVTFFILGLMMVGIAGVTFCLHLIQKFNPIIRTMLYTEISIIILVTLCMDLSYRGISILILYGMGFIFIGCCGIPIYLWEITRWKLNK